MRVTSQDEKKKSATAIGHRTDFRHQKRRRNHAQLTTSEPDPWSDMPLVAACAAATEGEASSGAGELRRRRPTTFAAAAAAAADARVQQIERARPLRRAPAAASASAASLRLGHGALDADRRGIRRK